MHLYINLVYVTIYNIQRQAEKLVKAYTHQRTLELSLAFQKFDIDQNGLISENELGVIF